ncbi:MAG: hypothetical protein ABIY55_18715, partial [Kofleriaceae bacterium]
MAVLLATALGFAAAAPHFHFTTQITDFLPDDDGNRGAQIAALLAQSELARIMVIDLSIDATHAPASEARPAQLASEARALIAFLGAQPDVSIARSGFTETDVTAMRAFLQAWPATTFLPAARYGEAQLRARLSELREQLGSPAGVVFRETAPRDPLGGMWEPLQALRGAQGSALVDEDGVLLTADHAHAFVFAETRSSPFDSDAQRAFRGVLDGWLASVPGTRMQTSGAAQFAIAGEAQVKGDVNRIGIISTVGILVIFLVLFGSVRMILLGFVPMLFGSAVAVLACQAVFGEIHGLTIAFGTSLLGVGLDYVEHYYAHFVLMPTVPARAMMKEVAPSLALGAVTTIIGFVGIAASGLGGLRQMAVFSVIAIIASMVATYWIVLQWMPTKYRPPRSLGAINRVVLALLVRLRSKTWSRKSRLALFALAVVAAVASVWGARFSDNVNMLVNDRGPHVVEDRTVRSRLGPESSSYAVVTAPTDEALLT